MNFEPTIEKLRALIQDPVANASMNLSTIKGFLGELLVAERLQTEGADVLLKGNQSGHDLEIDGGAIKIDVKLSTLKSEVKGCPNYWGWPLRFERNVDKDVTCTHFVCIGVNDELKPVRFYVIEAGDLTRFPQCTIPQFKKVKHGFAKLEKWESIEEVKDSIQGYFEVSKKLVDEKIAVRVRTEDSLLSVLRS